jgi:3-deoxy-D-manno-octulosonic-acid transferase
VTLPAWYRLATRAVAPLLRLRFAWRARQEPAYGVAVGERYGRYAPDVAAGLQAFRASTGPRLWLHAVSLGETRAALALVDALRTQVPDLRVAWTHGTATGREAGRAALKPGDVQLWQPLDTTAAVQRFFAATQPTAGVLMETEVWPALLAEARQQQVPMVLANARLSERSARRGERWRALLKPAVAGLARVLAQTPEDAGRLVAAGARAECVQVCGNLKFDMSPAADQLALGRAWKRSLGDRPVLMLASSREGEELDAVQHWAEAWPDAATRPLLLIVPRHPQRFDEVARLCSAAGWPAERRSSWGEALPGRQALASDVWLGDSLGEMAAYYALADLALLGGSFAPLGGQNLIEAAACGCPLLMGPHTFNFADAAERALQAGAAARVVDMASAMVAARAWFHRSSDGVPAGSVGAPRIDRNRALAFAEAHRGAAQRMAAAVLPLLQPRR